MDRHRDSRRQIPRLDPGTLLNQCRLINKETQTIRPYGLRRERHLHKTKKHCSKTSGWQEGGKRDSCVFSEMLRISRDSALLRCLSGSRGAGLRQGGRTSLVSTHVMFQYSLQFNSFTKVLPTNQLSLHCAEHSACAVKGSCAVETDEKRGAIYPRTIYPRTPLSSLLSTLAPPDRPVL